VSDQTYLSLYPQDLDGRHDLRSRRARSSHNLSQRLVAGSAALLNGGSDATGTGTILAANPLRKKWGVQNAGMNVLTVTLGGAAIDLRAANANDTGQGASLEDEDWKGTVAVSGSSTRYHFWEG